MELPRAKRSTVLLAALILLESELEKRKKSLQAIDGMPTTEVDAWLLTVASLKQEHQGVGSAQGNLLDMVPEGGDTQTALTMRDDDGTDLQATPLAEWLQRTAGAYIPADVVSNWALEIRKTVAKWLRAIDARHEELDQEAVEAAVKDNPDFDDLSEEQVAALWDRARNDNRNMRPIYITAAYFTKPTAETLRDRVGAAILTIETASDHLPEDVVQAHYEKGPWSVRPASDERYEVFYTLKDRDPAPEWGTWYEKVEKAMAVAAILNHRVAQAAAGEGEPVTEVDHALFFGVPAEEPPAAPVAEEAEEASQELATSSV